MMRYNTIHKTGFKVSEISFGCMSLKSEGKDNDVIINKAIDGGINLFDTADLYEKGENERLLGNALKAKRKDVFISTKVGNQWRKDGSGWDWNPRKEYILNAVDDSLKRLQTDYIDLYLLHGGTMDDPMDESIEAFERLVDMGKIRSYGLSSIRSNVIREFVKRSNIAAVMTQYSYLDRRPEEETLNLLFNNNIGVLARGSMASGLLVDKPASDYLNLKAPEVEKIVNELKHNLPEGRTLQETVMRYVNGHSAVTTAVAGIRTLKQLEDAINTANTLPLMEEERQHLQALWTGNTYSEHR
ncbi:aldo/keto reductase [Flavobacterium sp. AG291]|uniref:aldo/keto reductase n=1 Tax=Flavobacterium sp. AG291 TaxID=2184000 RepID=UPI000E2E26DB|nr:aldo/keto reductase [Flavobacterium sp. AG291]RDI13409.1 aryl-alcohol dehydrogenase-like predicted oxidoreductase [Flavobacterium sp. AG291]